MMKTLFPFLMIFSFLLGFGQKKSKKWEEASFEEIECNRFVEQLNERNSPLIKEAEKINFKKIDKLIFKEIENYQFDKDSLIIFIEVCRNNHCGYPCMLNHKIFYPNYSEYEFWNSKNISKLSEKLSKKVKLLEIYSLTETKVDDSKNSLCLEFINLKEKIIVVKYIFDKNLIHYKTYQYQNKNWVEIPTTQEHEF